MWGTQTNAWVEYDSCGDHKPIQGLSMTHFDQTQTNGLGMTSQFGLFRCEPYRVYLLGCRFFSSRFCLFCYWLIVDEFVNLYNTVIGLATNMIVDGP